MAQKYHLTDNGPAKCTARKQPCPLNTEHGSKQELEHLYEKKNAAYALQSTTKKKMRASSKKATTDSSRSVHTDYNSYTEQVMEELNSSIVNFLRDNHPQLVTEGKYQEKLLENARRLKKPLTDKQIERRLEYIEKVTSILNSNGYNTIAFFNLTRGQPNTLSVQRLLSAQNAVFNEWDKKKENTPKENRALFSGGMGGAGKGTVLRALNAQDNYVVINTDDVKEFMAENGMSPRIPGLTSMESSTLIHEEASLYSSLVAEKFMKESVNLNYDTTLGNAKSARKKINTLHNNGYTVDAVFVDITMDNSKKRGASRYKIGINDYIQGKNSIGGRPVPKSVNKKAQHSQHSSRNAENLVELHKERMFADIKIFDNNGSKPERINNSIFFSK